MEKIIALFFMILVATGCPQLNLNCDVEYVFWIPISVNSSKSKYKVGDTITISMLSDNTNMLDSLGGVNTRIVNFPNFNPNAWFLMPKLDTIPVLDGLEENELILNSKYNVVTQFLSGEKVNGIFFLEIDTTETASRLDFKVILTKPGTYALYSISSLWRDSDNICFPGKCNGCGYGRGSVDCYFVYEGDNHKDILTKKNKEVEDYVWKDRSGQRKESSHYYFRVVQ